MSIEKTLEENLVRFDRREFVALITLNRASEQNALNAAMIASLSGVFNELKEDADVRVIILTGAGQAFSGGAGSRALTPEQAGSLEQALFDLIENLGKPVIAAVNGPASGGGCELALACAWRMASPHATFGQPEIFSGLMPGLAGTTRLPRIIGKARALEMLLNGEPVGAEEAMGIGLVNRIVDGPEALLPACEELARQISRNAPLAIKYALEAVNHGSAVSIAEGLRLESALFGLCFATEDAQEGTRAFLEKRPAVFKGR
ncbi:MAG: enoyl-CoA hydratase-related protein [Acidobacteriota bacterium]